MDLLYEFSLLWLTLFFMLLGLIGIAVPFFPGLLIIWLTALGYGALAGFSGLGVFMMILITVAMLFGSIVDNVFAGAGARGGGASWKAIAVGMVGGVIGTFLIPVPLVGGFIAALVGILGFEAYRHRDFWKGFRAMRGWAVGCGWAYVVRLLSGILMIELWVIWVLWG
ncbi:MAG: DUF456 domain-containing protein [Anaerolineales bacterium]|nr:DUF456 domain-containing protein [Anaerolineales bacterium]